MKKKIGIIIGVVLGVIILLIGLFIYSLSPVGKTNTVTITISKGDSKDKILNNLKSNNLIRSKYSSLLYLIITGKRNLQAGTYELNGEMSAKEIITSLYKGEVINIKKPSVKITFKEGITLKEYMELLASNTDLEYESIIKEVNDKAFLEKLINDYPFLTTDILNDKIYYGLEGYLYPETYEFYKDTTLDMAIRKMLNTTKAKLSEYDSEINKSGYTYHQILTMASIIEKEANNYDDRCKVSQVIYKRLATNMSLGMDVTAYYGVQKKLSDNNITYKELNDNNPYNTRLTSFMGLPIGPICNPSINSIKAALNPSDTDYVYFFADIITGKVYFTNSETEFNEFKRIYG